MTIRHLRIFMTVYEEKSMTLAANKLFMTQPSVSQAIKELELYYETPLFERLSRKLYVTQAGKMLYQYAEHILTLFDDLEKGIKGANMDKVLTTGANYTVGVVLIHQYIEEFKKNHPLTEIKVSVNKTSELAEMLKENKLDLALTDAFDSKTDLIEEYFCDDKIVIVANPKHHLCEKEVVETGMSDGIFTSVTGELEEGDLILVPVLETNEDGSATTEATMPGFGGGEMPSGGGAQSGGSSSGSSK